MRAMLRGITNWLAGICALWIIVMPFAPTVLSVHAQVPETLIVIDADRQSLTLYKDGKQIAKYGVATGKPDSPTPVGVWQINSKHIDWGSGFGTRFLGLNVPWGTFGIHGTNKPGSIGNRASAGCIRMFNKDVEKLFSQVSVGTPVIIEGFTGGPSDAYRAAPGDRGAFIAHVQLRLRNLGYYHGSIDGIYGRGMRDAVLRYRKAMGMSDSDIIDWDMSAKLGIIRFE